MASAESDVMKLLEAWSVAVRSRDIEAIMALYAPDIVYFDVVPPLQIAGSDAVRRNFLRWFAGWKTGIGSEARDLKIFASADTAIAFKLHRTSGTLKGGREVGYWVRVTVCCRKSDDRWLITHEHVSVPTDFETGRAVLDLAP